MTMIYPCRSLPVISKIACFVVVVVVTSFLGHLPQVHSLNEEGGGSDATHHLRRGGSGQKIDGQQALVSTRRDQDLNGRIVGGRVIPDVEEYTFLVSLFVYRQPKDDEEAKLGLTCGGTLISPTIVLTAAHCVGGLTHVRVGLSEMEGIWISTNETGVEVIEIEDYIRHPNYDHVTKNNDFALLKLSRNVTTATPIHLNYNSAAPQTGNELTVLGWGLTSVGGNVSGEPLLTEVEVIDNHVCRQMYRRKNYDVTSNMLCTWKRNQDACGGDSGGPLVQRVNNEFTLVGVISWGEGCASHIYPGVYSRVSRAYSWIESMKARLEGE